MDLHRLIPFLAADKGFRVSEISVEHKKRKFGKSRYKLFRYRGLLDIIALAASHTTQIRPFHFFCELAAVFFLLAALSFITWCLSYESLPLFAQIFIAVGGLWSLSFGTLLSLLGFCLEIESSRFQRLEYRQGMLKETIDSRS